MTWVVTTWGKAVDEEIDGLSNDIKARLARFRLSIETFGPQSLPPKHAKYLGDRLWELRLIGRDGIARIIYVTVQDKQVVLLRAFVKKTQKTPLRELELAKQRAKVFLV